VEEKLKVAIASKIIYGDDALDTSGA